MKNQTFALPASYFRNNILKNEGKKERNVLIYLKKFGGTSEMLTVSI